MPNPSIALNRVFQALANPTRRAVLERLSSGPAAVISRVVSSQFWKAVRCLCLAAVLLLPSCTSGVPAPAQPIFAPATSFGSGPDGDGAEPSLVDYDGRLYAVALTPTGAYLWGEAGDNYNHVQVYHQEGKPCVRCGSTIERIVVAQRSTHFCPGCQQLTRV